MDALVSAWYLMIEFSASSVMQAGSIREECSERSAQN